MLLEIIKILFWNSLPRKVKNFFHLLMAVVAVVYYRWPSRRLVVIGVTGTDGKTTTASLIHHIIEKFDRKAGLVTSVEASIGSESFDTGLHTTTPNPFKLQKFLRKMVERDCKYAVLEVTSHGLDQCRVLGCNFQIGVLTNVTREHLDYHSTYEEYLRAKLKLLKRSNVAIINGDESSFEPVKDYLSPSVKVLTYGIKSEADYRAIDLELSADGLSFRLGGEPVRSPLVGEYNAYNILAAVAAAELAGVGRREAIEAVASFSGLRGRFDGIKNNRGLNIVIDFAHTPNALEQVLKLVSKLKASDKKIILTFGCAGERDRSKRPEMGKIAATYADLIVLTAEDPRTEKVDDIIRAIAEGSSERGAREADVDSELSYDGEPLFFCVSDRQGAISFAIRNLASEGDWVLICGKGHERSMCYGREERSWSDHEAVELALSYYA